jgi:hypothetical protein
VPSRRISTADELAYWRSFWLARCRCSWPFLTPRSTLQDFVLATLTTVAIWLLLKVEGFTKAWYSIFFGVVFAIGVLTKISFGVAIAIPMLVVLITTMRRIWTERRQAPIVSATRGPLMCLALFILFGATAPVLWYSNNWSSTVAYINTAFILQPGTLAHPLTAHNQGVLAMSTINNAISWQIAIIGIATLAAGIVGLVRSRYRPTWGFERACKVVFLGSWVLLPYFAVAVSSNHDPRYAVASLSGFGVVLAGWISRLAVTAVRRTIAGVAILASLTMTLQVESSRWRIPGLHYYYAIDTPYGFATLQLAPGVGSATNFIPQDYAENVMDYLEDEARGPNGKIKPLSIALLQLHGDINGNTMPYFATIRRLPFTFDTIFVAPKTNLAATLKNYDIALYLSQPPSQEEVAFGRVAQLNDTAAAHHMTPAIFAMYESNAHSMYVGPDSGQGDYMYFLVRKK